MDETLLRRLVGAAVLLAFAFLLASLLPDPQRPANGVAGGVTYDLRTGKPIEHAVAPAVAPAPPAVSIGPLPAHHPAQGSFELPDAPAEDQAPATAPAAATAPPAASATAPVKRPSLKVDESLDEGAGGWYVQVGSFSSQANARAALQKLYGLGLPTMIQSVAVGKTIWYRVRVGPYAAEAPARDALAKIQKQGYAQSKLVKPDTAPDTKGN